MKIIHLLSQVELTGAEVYAIDLSDELIKRNHTCYIVSDKIHKRTKATFIPLTIHSAKFFRRLRSILFLRQFLKANKIDIVHAHSRAAVRIGFWATRFSECALISTLHGKQHFSYSKKLFNIYGENILGVCENVKQHFIYHFGFHDSQVQIARNFLNTDTIDLLSAGLVPNESNFKIVSFLGRTSGPKGLNWEYIINTYIEDWILKYPHTVFQFAGGEAASFSTATQQKIKRLTLSYPIQFKFLGKMDHLFQIIQSSDIVLGSGRIAIESLYLQKIVLAIGEEFYLGKINLNNLEQMAESNFGDIDSQIKYAVDFERLRTDVEFYLSNPNAYNHQETSLALKTKTTDYFNRDFEVGQLLETYEWAQFKRRFPKNIPILMYHQIVDSSYTSQHKTYITESLFQKHMSYLRSAGFTSLTFKELLEYKKNIRNQDTFPSRPIIITFDDGYESNWQKVVPILQQYQMKAVFYILAKLHDYNFWDADSGTPELKLMSLEQRKKIADNMEIGSHGFNHEKLSTMNRAQATAEIQNSKTELEKELGQPIISYAYTYGDRSDRDIYLAKKAGYDFAVNTTRGVFHFADNPHNLFRVSIFPTDTVKDLARKTRSWYRRYYFYKRKE